jgi:hypothetical protein
MKRRRGGLNVEFAESAQRALRRGEAEKKAA